MTSKTNSSTSTVFFGTGDVSLKTLEGIADDISIEAVITKPDLTTSSGKSIAPAIKTWAQQRNIPCYQPANKTELVSLVGAAKFSSDLGLVVDYGLIIPESVIRSFKLGILNSHFSLLPKWRGADPITWSVLAGDNQTGVTIMQVDAGMDTGDILATEKISLSPNETTQSLTTKLIELSNTMLVRTIPRYISGQITPTPQDNELATYSTKISKEMGQLNPMLSAVELERQVRAFRGWPSSYIPIHDTLVTIKEARVSSEQIEPGHLVWRAKKLLYGCNGGSLEIVSIQPAGKSAMDGASFVNGYKHLLHG